MGLFKLGDFTLHSGSKSYWKIDCDALADEDWATLARMVYESVGKFRKVVGIPQGGLKLAKALKSYRFLNPQYPTLIVDDVLTTGNSMEKMKKSLSGDCIGAVVFARGKCPSWITPLLSVASGKVELKGGLNEFTNINR